MKLISYFHDIIGDEVLLNCGVNFQYNLLFHMRNYKIAMATFRTSQCQDDDRNLK